MKITYAKVIGVLILLTLGFGTWAIVKFFSKEDSNEGVDLFNLNETKKESQIKEFYDEEGRSMKILIQQHCIDSHRTDCKILKNNLTELKTWIKENEFTKCAIVKYAENNCTETKGLECYGKSCSVPNDERSTTDITKLGFWLQDYFYVTKQNYEAVNNSIHLKRFTCIKRKSSWKDGICIKNLTPERGAHDYLLDVNVRSYFAKNLKNYTRLPKRIAELIDLKNLTDGTQIYYKNGKKVDSYQNEEVYVFPSKLTLTKEIVSWMRHDMKMSEAICNSLGFRKLSIEEIEALPAVDPHIQCFYDEKGSPFINKTSNVWAFGPGVGTYDHYIEVMDNEGLMLASKKMDVIYVNTTLVTKIPNNWIKIHEHVFLKKNGSRTVYTPNIECKEFEENKEFKEFTTTDYVIVECKENTTINRPKIENFYLYSMKEQLPANFKDDLFKTEIGRDFFVRYGTINDETLLPNIDETACKKLLQLRNEDPRFQNSGIKCLERDGRTYISKKVEEVPV